MPDAFSCPYRTAEAPKESLAHEAIRQDRAARCVNLCCCLPAIVEVYRKFGYAVAQGLLPSYNRKHGTSRRLFRR
ncbi:Hypothetical protein GbCGDNIH2_5021 [Granulibacter bethesdensis]|nr:Hypothetical protein GbCGDNIH4_5021 [Granulibacter bethesdensis CGDNIH4]AHJ67541.1 Hypothetical protein GbCGDNIH2_5021 [Granulibacter bethesdensis]